MRTPSVPFRVRARKGTIRPVVHLTMFVGPVVNFQIDDFTLLAGDTVTITVNGTPHNFVEGVQWSRLGGNAAAAASLGSAISADGGTQKGVLWRNNQISIARYWDVAITTLSVTLPGGMSSNPGLPAEVEVVFAEDNYDEAIALIGRCSSFGGSLDIIGHKLTHGEFTLEMIDNWDYSLIRKLKTRTTLEGIDVQIRVGFPDIDIADFFDLGVYYWIDDSFESGYNRITLKSRKGKLRGRITTLDVLNMHPTIALLTAIQQSGVGINNINAPTFDDTLDSEIQHWGVSASHALTSPRFTPGTDVDGTYSSGKELVDYDVESISEQLLAMVDGYLIENEDGDIELVRFDPNATPVRIFEEDDVADFKRARNPIRYTRVTVQGAYRTFAITNEYTIGEIPWDFHDRREVISLVDRIAASYQGNLEGDSEEHTLKYDCGLFFGTQPVVMALTNIAAVAADTLLAVTPAHGGLAGSRENDLTVHTQRAGDELDAGAGKTAILQRIIYDGRIQYIEADTLLIESGRDLYPTVPGLQDEFFNDDPNVITAPALNIVPLATADGFAGISEYHISDYDIQNVYGTLLNGNIGLSVLFDATIAYWMCLRYLARFAWGCDIYRFRVNLSDIGLELNDLVYMNTKRSVSYMRNGALNNVRWQVIGFEIDFGDSPGIYLTIAFASEDNVDFYSAVPPDVDVGEFPPMGGEPVGEAIFERDGDLVIDRFGDIQRERF